jgi:hypothetical protein
MVMSGKKKEDQPNHTSWVVLIFQIPRNKKGKQIHYSEGKTEVQENTKPRSL